MSEREAELESLRLTVERLRSELAVENVSLRASLAASQAEAGALREALRSVADSWDAWWAAEDEVWTDESRWKRERTYAACNEAHKQARALSRLDKVSK
jgi:hypothetical protein